MTMAMEMAMAMAKGFRWQRWPEYYYFKFYPFILKRGYVILK
jgi:hypothetical protein